MDMTGRERVTSCLRFERPDRVPRDLWVLPWATTHFPKEVQEIRDHFPTDFGGAGDVYRPSPRVKGDMYGVGSATDDWGCVFTNIHAGVIGEVNAPLVAELDDWDKAVQPPYETLPADLDAARDRVNRACAESSGFVRASCCARPWERLQFLRTTVTAMMDVMDPDERVRGMLKKIHDFYMKELEFWVTTDVDAINFMDDWGAQNQLLIPPPVWRELFKPLYEDYCDIAHQHGKFVFMHSDGHISEIYEDLVEIGVDALNSQLFCMDMAELAAVAKGRMTFWGEIDRQHVLPAKDPQAGRDAVRQVARHLYDPAGGIIAQFEIGPGSNPAVARAIFEEWELIDREHRLQV